MEESPEETRDSRAVGRGWAFVRGRAGHWRRECGLRGALAAHRARVRNAARGRYRHIVSNLLISQFRGALMFY